MFPLPESHLRGHCSTEQFPLQEAEPECQFLALSIGRLTFCDALGL